MRWRRRRLVKPAPDTIEAPAGLEAPTGVWAMFADDTRVELEPTFIGFDGPIAVWQVKLGEEHGPMVSMGAGKIPPNVGIEWLIPGMPRWRHP